MREATEEDVPAVVDVYIRAYAQPPWNERHEPVSSEGYLRWVLSQPGAFILVSADEALRQPPQGIVLASPRDYAEFVRDWERLAERPRRLAGRPGAPGLHLGDRRASRDRSAGGTARPSCRGRSSACGAAGWTRCCCAPASAPPRR